MKNRFFSLFKNHLQTTGTHRNETVGNLNSIILSFQKDFVLNNKISILTRCHKHEYLYLLNPDFCHEFVFLIRILQHHNYIL